MNLVNKLFLGLAAATLVSASAFAGTVTQTIGPVSSDSYVSWTRQDLGDITLAQYTSSITGLNSSITLVDQGWGFQDYGNGVSVALYDQGVDLYNFQVAGASHNTTTQTFDITANPSILAGLNAALGTVNWNGAPTVQIELYTTPFGYPGWELHTHNDTLSVTSVPEPASMALLGLGLLSLTMLRRRKS